MTISPTRRKRRTGDRGFTMLELLMVIVIIGIMAIMIVPTVTGSDVARVRSAARGVIQMSRYARTMAVLRQQTLTLDISTDGVLKLSGAKDEAAVSSAPREVGEREGEGAVSDASPVPASGGKTLDVTETNTERSFKQVKFFAELAEEELDESEAGTRLASAEKDEELDDKGKPVRLARRSVSVPYEGNGRCLPYRVVIVPEGGGEGDEQAIDRVVVTVDRFGNAKVVDEEE